MPLSGVAQLHSGDVLTSTSRGEHKVGALGVSNDDRMFRFCLVSSSGSTAGYLQQAAAAKTNHDNCAVDSSGTSAWDTSITITLGATAATANEYKEGLLIANDEAPEGIAMKIKSHPAADSSATLTLELYDPIPEATTASTSEFCLWHNPYYASVEGTVQAGLCAGVPLVDVSASEYAWVQTKGAAPVLSDEDGTVNRSVTVGSSTSGAVEEKDDMVNATDATRFDLEPLVGFQVVAMIDGEFRPIYLALD